MLIKIPNGLKIVQGEGTIGIRIKCGGEKYRLMGYTRGISPSAASSTKDSPAKGVDKLSGGDKRRFGRCRRKWIRELGTRVRLEVRIICKVGQLGVHYGYRDDNKLSKFGRD